MANIYFISLGCDKNRIDAEIMARRLIDGGHTVVDEAAGADCAVVNTCGFIESAKEEAIGCIFDMVREKERGTVRAIVVTGCLAQRYREELLERMPEVDAAVGIAGNADICDVVAQVLGGARLGRFGDPEALPISGARALSTPGHYAYLKIAEGCDNRCAFCAIPAIRGRYRSRPEAEIVGEAEALAAQGVRELILIAQDTTAYGSDLRDGSCLAGLLEKLCEVEGLWRLRLLYAYPDRIDGQLISVMAAQPKIAKYIDIPLQHASADILRSMGRFGGREQLLGLVGRLRSAMPGITLRSTFIVGFPGETEGQFAELLDFLGAARLDRAGCFTFSPEEGTAAAALPGQLGDDIKRERAERFFAAQADIMARGQQDRLGSRMEVICDGFDEEAGCFACRGESDAPDIDTAVLLPLACDLVPGEIYQVEITGTEGADLCGKLV